MTTTDTMKSSERKLKITLRIAGAILWMLVIAYFVYFYKQKEKLSNVEPTTLPPAVKIEFVAYEIPDFKLINQDGKEVTKKDLEGRHWVVSFIFTRCRDGCPQVVESLQKLKAELGDLDVGFLSISVDPKYDSVEVLKHYADALKVRSDRWIFLTGSQEEIYKLVQEGFRLPVEQKTGAARKPGEEVAHSSSLLYLDPNGNVIEKINAIDPGERTTFAQRIRDELAKQQGQQP